MNIRWNFENHCHSHVKDRVLRSIGDETFRDSYYILHFGSDSMSDPQIFFIDTLARISESLV